MHENSLGNGGSFIPENLISTSLYDADIKTILGKKGLLFLVDTSRPHRGLEPSFMKSRHIASASYCLTNLGNP